MRCALIGDPAEHSLSPAIHRDGYARLGLDWRYDAITVTPEDLEAFVGDCEAAGNWAGLSVTAPHKEAIVAFGEPDEITSLVGAGNTLVFHEGKLSVHNTDVPGFVRAWRTHSKENVKTAAVVGNGATARSLIVALAGLGVAELVLVVRNPARTDRIVQLSDTLGMSVKVQTLDEPLPPVALVASTIPAPATASWAHQWAAAAEVVFDVVYDPWPTPLADAAARSGRTALNGLDLLAGQAVDQFFLLTGGLISFEDARRAAGRELRSRHSA